MESNDGKTERMVIKLYYLTSLPPSLPMHTLLMTSPESMSFPLWFTAWIKNKGNCKYLRQLPPQTAQGTAGLPQWGVK